MSGDPVQFFGEVDINKHGRHASEYPSWYNAQHVDELKESIDSMERALARGQVPAESREEARLQLAREKDKLQKILMSKPKHSGPQTDALAKAYRQLGSEIKSALFNYSEMEKGTADAHEEMHRMVDPVITVPTVAKQFLSQMGITMTDGKISRNAASKAYKILGRLLDENTNVETLRKMK